MNKKSILLLLSFVVSLVTYSQLTYQLSNKFWRLKNAYINGENYNFSSKISEAPTLQFSGNNIRGNGGCNAYHSKFTIDGNDITIANVMSTKMACSNSELNESAYFNALSQNHSLQYNESQNELIMTNQSGDKLYFYSLFTKSSQAASTPVRQRVYTEEPEETPVRYTKNSRNKRTLIEESISGKKVKLSKKELAREKLLERKMNSKKGKLTKKERRELMALQSKEKKLAKSNKEVGTKIKNGKRVKLSKKELAAEKKKAKKEKATKKGKKSKEKVAKSKKGTTKKSKIADKKTKSKKDKNKKRK